MVSGCPIVSVMPYICMRFAPNRSSHSASWASVMFCANMTSRKLFCRSWGSTGCARIMRMGAANRLVIVHSYLIACFMNLDALNLGIRATLAPTVRADMTE